MRVLAVNAGSSSVKLSVVEGEEQLAGVTVARAGEAADAAARLCAEVPPVGAVGHRVVHGGPEHERPLLLDDDADDALESLGALAPLHNPPALALVEALRRVLPDIPHVACFDTSFHATMPPRASTYALPRRWREQWGVRRYGFHGLSHAWASRRAAALVGRPIGELCTLSAHLGSGASLCAVRGGRSVDTTMGFTPLEGVVMATRSGSVDPGAVLWAVRRGALSVDDVEADLERHAGLLGLSERSPDLREVLAGAAEGDSACVLAYDVYVYRLQAAAGAMAVALGHLDAVVFTGGAGEGSQRLRADVCDGLGIIGVGALGALGGGAADEDGVGAPAGGPAAADRVLTAEGVVPAVLVVHAREDVEIARGVREVLGR